MAHYGNVLVHLLSSASEVALLFEKGNVLNSRRRTDTNRGSVETRQGRIVAAPARRLCTLHISAIFSFMDSVQFQYYIEKNYKHKDARQETYNFTRCLGLGYKADGVTRSAPKTKVFVFTITCKGTSLCRATPIAAPTSKRRFCGYGIRLYALNGDPDQIIVEQFGRHNDLLEENDAGHALLPPQHERRRLTMSMELDALRSFARGLTPSRHITYISEGSMLASTTSTSFTTNSSSDCTILGSIFSTAANLKTIRTFYRRFRRISHPMQDVVGVMNFIKFLNSQQAYYIDHLNTANYSDEEPLVILILVREICESAYLYANDVLGLDATFDVTIYKFALFAIMGRSGGGALPFGYFVASSKSERAVAIGLSMFKRGMNSILLDQDIRLCGEDYALNNFSPFSPKAFCIDKDDAELGAVRSIFPDCTVILCHYHAMTIWIDEARAERHKLEKDEVVVLMNYLRELSSCSSLDEFPSIVKKIHELSPSFYTYFLKYFLNDRWADTFSEVNRTHLSLSVIRTCRSNMLVEVSFKTLKYIIFAGVQNRRLDELLYAIAFKLYPYFIVRHNGVCAFRPRFITGLQETSQGSLLFRY